MSRKKGLQQRQRQLCFVYMWVHECVGCESDNEKTKENSGNSSSKWIVIVFECERMNEMRLHEIENEKR